MQLLRTDQGANWSHPCCWLLYTSDSAIATVISTNIEFPLTNWC